MMYKANKVMDGKSVNILFCKAKCWKVLCICLLLGSVTVNAQELNARVQINSDQVQGTNKQVFQTLQSALTEFVNARKWSDTQFGINEKIECTFSLTIRSVNGDQYTGELQVQTRRPVYGAVLVTTLFNHRDIDIQFPYREFEPLEFANNNITSNLTAIFAYYIYMVLGYDFDSFSLNGGQSFFEAAEQIASMAQSMQLPGWTSFDNVRSRNSIIASMLDNTGKIYREMMYVYHRQGLDEMNLGVERGRAKILTALPGLNKIRELRANSPLLFLFSDAKLEEVADIFSKSPSAEKQQVYTILQRNYPALETRYAKLSEGGM